MKIQLAYEGENYEADLSKALDISIPLGARQMFLCN